MPPAQRRGPSPAEDLRELLYGDVPLARWAAESGSGVWALFRQAASCLANQDRAGARQALIAVLDTPAVESRHCLQAWNALRSLGETPPPAESKHLYGVVVDMPVSGGRDTLAAYEDGTCRYVNFSGSILIWDAPDSTTGPLVDQLLDAGTRIVERIGPWQGPRPPLPAGHARLSLLCPSGLHFGQAPLAMLQSDVLAARAFAAAAALLHVLVGRAAPR